MNSAMSNRAMASLPSVSSRPALEGLLAAFDKHCKDEFTEELSKQLGKRKRRMARVAVQSMRDAIRAKIKKYVIIHDEVPENQRAMEPIDEAAQARVSELMRKAEMLQMKLEQNRKFGLTSFEQQVQAGIDEMAQQGVDDSDVQELQLVKECTEKETLSMMPTIADMNRVERDVDDAKQCINEIAAKVQPKAVNEARELLGVVEDTIIKSSQKPSMLQQMLQEDDRQTQEQVAEAEGESAEKSSRSEEPEQKKQRLMVQMTF